MEKKKIEKKMFTTRIKEPICELLNDYHEKTGIAKSRIVEDALEEYFNKRNFKK